MTEIKVIGDILSGKFQPTLTGNRVVDAALLAHFCQNLATALHLPTTQVHVEHHWDLTVAPNALYLIDDQILGSNQHLRNRPNVIAVAHKDLLRGHITTTKRLLADKLTLNSTLN